MRLIDADVLIKAIHNTPVPEEYWIDQNDVNYATELVRRCPTIDPSNLRPKGEWIPFENRWGGGVPWSGQNCSLCKATIGKKAKYKFCPNCGADMRGDA